MDDDDDDISYFGNIHPVDGKVKFTTPKEQVFTVSKKEIVRNSSK